MEFLELIEPSTKIKDEKLNVEFISQYNLLLQVSNDYFRMSIVDSLNNRCLHLEEYKLENTHGFAGKILEQIHVIYDEHHLLNAGFWKSIKLNIVNDKFTLVPSSLFIEESAREYLKFNCDIDSIFDTVSFYRHRGSDIVNVHAADSKIVSWFKGIYPAKKIELIHQTSACIEGMLQGIKDLDKKSMLISLDNSLLTVLVVENKKLQFCNTFSYKAEEDLIYFILLVIDELKIDRENDQVILFGDIEHDSEVFSRLYQYIRQLRFGTKPSNIIFSFWFDEVFDHKYFDLYSLHLCE